MARKKHKFTPRTYEKIGNSNLSCVLYASMLQHESYTSLSSNAKILFTYMKLQLFGQNPKPQNNNDYFFFNKQMYVKTYRLFSNGEQFAKYSHELIAHGFIEEVENGKTTRTKNIYKFSDKWQTWTQGTDYRPLYIKQRDEAREEKKIKKHLQTREN